jgi:hypothetical protein
MTIILMSRRSSSECSTHQPGNITITRYTKYGMHGIIRIRIGGELFVGSGSISEMDLRSEQLAIFDHFEF